MSKTVFLHVRHLRSYPICIFLTQPDTLCHIYVMAASNHSHNFVYLDCINVGYLAPNFVLIGVVDHKL